MNEGFNEYWDMEADYDAAYEEDRYNAEMETALQEAYEEEMSRLQEKAYEEYLMDEVMPLEIDE